MIELYAIADAGAPADLDGLEGVEAGRLLAICGPADDEPVSAERLWERERVLDGLMRQRDLLPVRYGTRVQDRAAAAAVLRERHDELAAALDTVRGAVELAVRVATTETALGSTHARTRVYEPLALLARGARTLPAGDDLLRAAYLVERDGVDRFTRKVTDLQRVNSELRILCTGPWPPYSFTTP